jgi:hypothetical protein
LIYIYGLVAGASWFNSKYLISAPIVVTVQPQALPTCELQNTSIPPHDSRWWWEILTNGNCQQMELIAILNNATYKVTTNIDDLALQMQ